MAGIDVSMKHAIAEFPEDWAEFVGVRKGTHVRVVDSDVSTVATLADKVIEVGGNEPFVLHLEPQAYYDKGLDVRMFEANGRLTKRHGRFVHTCVVLLDVRPGVEPTLAATSPSRRSAVAASISSTKSSRSGNFPCGDCFPQGSECCCWHR